MTTHTVFLGKPSPERTMRLLVNSYSMGPLVPSETFLRYQKKILRAFANALNVTGALAVFERIFSSSPVPGTCRSCLLSQAALTSTRCLLVPGACM